jgi:hypothetical protein
MSSRDKLVAEDVLRPIAALAHQFKALHMVEPQLARQN